MDDLARTDVVEETTKEPHPDDGADVNDDDTTDEGSSQGEVSEPLLKYERIKGVVERVVGPGNEEITCVALHEDFLLLGTTQGVVHQTCWKGSLMRSVHHHRGRVTSLSVDRKGDTFASASDDGKVCVYTNVSGSSHELKPQIHVFNQAVKAVAVDPNFSQKRDQVIVSGGQAGKCLITKRGWFKTEHIELHKGEGPVHAIAWHTRFIAWANDVGVKIFDYERQQRIAFIERPEMSPGTSICPCRIKWENDTTLLLGWADAVKVVKLKSRHVERKDDNQQARNSPSPTGSNHGAGRGVRLPRNRTASPETKFAEVVMWYQVDAFFICGVAPFGPHRLVLLGYTPDAADGEMSSCPEMRIVSRHDGTELSCDTLPIRGVPGSLPFNYGLECNVGVLDNDGLPLMYVRAAKDVIVARPADAQDRISWALETHKFDYALDLAESAGHANENEPRRSGHSFKDAFNATPLRFDTKELRERYLNYLFDSGRYDDAAKRAGRLLKDDKSLWDTWVTRFAQVQAVDSIALNVPLRDPRLSPESYEAILRGLAATNPPVLLAAVWEWRHEISSDLLFDMNDRRIFLVGNLSVHVQVLRAIVDTLKSYTHLLNPAPFISSTIAHGGVALFDVRATIDSLNLKLIEDTSVVLLDCLLILYLLNHQPGHALKVCLDALSLLTSHGGDPDTADANEIRSHHVEVVFELIKIHGFIGPSQQSILQIVQLHPSRAIDLLASAFPSRDTSGGALETQPAHANGEALDQTAEKYDSDQVLDVRAILDALTGNRLLQYKFMKRVFDKRRHDYDHPQYGNVHDLHVELCAEYNPEGLLGFLKWSNYYTINSALRVCEAHTPEPLYNELVFILGRTGGATNYRRALQIVLEKLKSVSHALEFVEENGDESLWNEMLDDCSTDPTLVGDLLERAGSHRVDVVHLVRRIPEALQVPRLKARLIKVLDDTQLQVRLLDGCNAVLRQDAGTLLRRLYRVQRRAVRVSRSARCKLCTRLLNPHTVSMYARAMDVVVFSSVDCYHKVCLEDAAEILPRDFDLHDVLHVDDEAQDDDASDRTLSLLKKHCMIYALATKRGAQSSSPPREDAATEETVFLPALAKRGREMSAAAPGEGQHFASPRTGLLGKENPSIEGRAGEPRHDDSRAS